MKHVYQKVLVDLSLYISSDDFRISNRHDIADKELCYVASLLSAEITHELLIYSEASYPLLEGQCLDYDQIAVTF